MPLKDDLVFCLEMDDAEGVDATDEHASRDFTENGSIASVTGVGGSGLARDIQPPGEFFNRVSESALQVGDIDFCGSVWINIDVQGNMGIIGQYASAGDNRSWRLLTNNNNVQLVVTSDGTSGTITTLTTSGGLSVGTWAHIFFYHDSVNNEIGIIINDGTPTTQSYSSGVFTGTADMEIGRVQSGDLNAQVDQTAFWKGRVLSSSEITELYNSGAVLPYSSWTASGATAAITGTAVATIDEDDVTTGGKTIIITITGDTWVAAGGTFDAQRQAIIDELNSAQSETTGWNNEVRDKLAVTTVVRTSDTVVTITLSAQAAYDITAQETITVTVPASALVTSGDPVVASPSFTVDPVTVGLSHWMGVGGVSDTSFKYRGRTDGAAGDLQIRYSTNSNLSEATTSTGVTTDSSDDYTGGEEITGLTANTKYYYTPVVDGVEIFSAPFPSFMTFPAEGVDVPLTIAFGSCQDDGDDPVFVSIGAESPNLFLHLGDFGYTDSTVLSNQRSNYQTQHDDTLSDDYYSQVVTKIPVERVWDDHDYGEDNGDGDTTDKANSLQAWKEYTAYHDLANASNGIWRDFKIANVHIFVLDERYQREGTPVRFPTVGRFTADTGSSGTSLVIPSSASPSGTDDFYNGYYAKVGPTDKLYRVTDYVGATRTCTLERSADDLTTSSECVMAEKSILDMDVIASGQVDWLIAAINASTSRWKIIVSSASMNPTATGAGGVDPWATFDSDNMELFYLRDKITAENVVVVSGDMHFCGIDDGTNCVWPEFTCGPLNRPDGGVVGTWSEGTDTSGHKYGLITIATSPHTLTLTSKDADGATTASITPLVVSDAGGGSATIEIDPGTYSLTGTAINLEQGYKIPIDPGTYTSVGTPIDLEQGYKVDIGLGSYSITGTDTGLEQGYLVSIDSGSYSLSGTDISLEFNRVISITPGVYNYEGTDVNLVSGDTISLDPGSYSITGTSANLEYGRSLDVELGTYAITGTDLKLEQGYQVDLTPGEYSITGTDVDFSEGFTIRLDAGTYSISPQDVDFIYHRILTITPGVYTYTGTDVILIIAGEAIQGGQFIVGQSYIPGFQQAEIYVPGFVQGDSFNPGFVQAELN